MLYGVFNTPPNSIGGSAVCSFRLADISSAFDGQFKEQRNTGDNWLAVDPHRVPSPRPGKPSSILLQLILSFFIQLVEYAIPPLLKCVSQKSMWDGMDWKVSEYF